MCNHLQGKVRKRSPSTTCASQLNPESRQARTITKGSSAQGGQPVPLGIHGKTWDRPVQSMNADSGRRLPKSPRMRETQARKGRRQCMQRMHQTQAKRQPVSPQRGNRWLADRQKQCKAFARVTSKRKALAGNPGQANANNPNKMDVCIQATASLCAEEGPAVTCTNPRGVIDGTITEQKLATLVYTRP